MEVTQDNRLNWNTHITETLRKAYVRLKLYYPILNRNSSLSIRAGRDIYLLLLRPILTYASPVWGYTEKSKINRLQVFQNKMLRLAARAPRATRLRTLHKELNTPLLKDFMVKLGEKLYRRSPTIDNRLINQLGQYWTVWDRHKRPKTLLHPT